MNISVSPVSVTRCRFSAACQTLFVPSESFKASRSLWSVNVRWSGGRDSDHQLEGLICGSIVMLKPITFS